MFSVSPWVLISFMFVLYLATDYGCGICLETWSSAAEYVGFLGSTAFVSCGWWRLPSAITALWPQQLHPAFLGWKWQSPWPVQCQSRGYLLHNWLLCTVLCRSAAWPLLVVRFALACLCQSHAVCHPLMLAVMLNVGTCICSICSRFKNSSGPLCVRCYFSIWLHERHNLFHSVHITAVRSYGSTLSVAHILTRNMLIVQVE